MPDLTGRVAVGESKDEALSLIREAIELHLEAMREDGMREDAMREDGMAIPPPSSSGEHIEFGAA